MDKRIILGVGLLALAAFVIPWPGGEELGGPVANLENATRLEMPMDNPQVSSPKTPSNQYEGRASEKRVAEPVIQANEAQAGKADPDYLLKESSADAFEPPAQPTGKGKAPQQTTRTETLNSPRGTPSADYPPVPEVEDTAVQDQPVIDVDAGIAVPPSPPRRRPAQREAIEPLREPEPVSAVSTPALPDPAPERFAVLTEGTAIQIRLVAGLNSETARTGDAFEAVLDQDLETDDAIVVPRGSRILGRVVDVQEPGRVKGLASMVLTLDRIETAAGTYELRTNDIELEAEQSKSRDLKAVGISTAVGTALGAIFGGKKGAAIGGATGAGAGTAGVLLTRGRHVEIEAERMFSFRLERKVELRLVDLDP
jgi:hypothetical protein